MHKKSAPIAVNLAKQNIKKLLIIKHGALGDLIQIDGILRDIRHAYSNATICLLTAPDYLNLMQRSPYIDNFIEDKRCSLWSFKNQIRLFRQLKKEKFELVIDLQNSDRSRLYHQLFFPRIEWIGRKSSKLVESSGLAGLIKVLKTASIPTTHSSSPNVSWMADDVSEILSQSHIKRPYIVLIPGSSAKHPSKRWPYYDQIATMLIKLGYDVVSLIGPDELDLAKKIPGHTLIEQHGLLSWFELAGLLNNAGFVIGNDTGPSHVASCLNKPGLALFGSQTSASKTEIERGQFKALEINELSALSAEKVLAHVALELPSIPSQHPTRK